MKKTMKELFKQYCGFIQKERNSGNILEELDEKFESNELNFYEFLDSRHRLNKILFNYSEYLSKTGISEISISENNIIFTTKLKGLKLVVNEKDRRNIAFELLNFPKTEQTEMELLKQIGPFKGVALDIGANIGWFSLFLSAHFSDTKIYAFEPIEDVFNNLVTNISINRKQNIHPYKIAITDTKGQKEFFYAPEISVLSSAKNIIDYNFSKTVQVQSDTLDGFISSNVKENIDFVKCDVEGGEINIIKAGLNTIEKNLPIFMIELFHEWTEKFGYHPNELLNILKKYDYSFFLPFEHGLELVPEYVPNNFSRQNYFIFHNTKHKKFIEKLRIK